MKIDIENIKNFAKKYGAFIVPIGIGLFAVIKNTRVAKPKKAKRRNSSVAKLSTSTTNVPSRIKTKSGKVISGKANVLAYRKRLRNLAKARKSKK